ncbi:hypothetical protein M9194_19635 [Vibrio sp. S4M6]|uniref:hypothetical protein n=1 Tax=Vibrio sinus TaxID=2946865 RepID=UPI00202A6CA8|nr:hypothetical protein [Vibrio sinus]MCL9783640.1 hypothetical protein [Vibrio sinus]
MICRECDTTLSDVVIHHVDAYLESSYTKRDTFVKELLIPKLISRQLVKEPDDTTGYQRWLSSKCKSIERILTGETTIRADWAFPIVSSLPQEYKQKAMIEICGFLGSYYIPIAPAKPPYQENKEVQAKLSELSKEFSDVLMTSKPAMDGVYSSKDNSVEVQQYANELLEVAAAAIAEIGRVYQGTGIEPAAYRAMSQSPFFKL